MKFIENIVEPKRILLSWKARSATPRRNYVVGEVFRTAEGATLRYLSGTPDFAQATKSGFHEYTAFPVTTPTHTHSVMDSFLKRIPPRSRSDFGSYVKAFGISEEKAKAMSDFALLAYCEGKLPGDGFSFVHPFDDFDGPCELVSEVAGFRHHGASIAGLLEGTPVSFQKDPGNQYDRDAVKILAGGKTVGFIAHTQLPTFNRWLNKSKISGSLERLNGTSAEPRAFIFVQVEKRST